MKRISRITLIVSLLVLLLTAQITYADTLEEQLNNLVGPKEQYDTMLSPVYLRNNYTEEYISSQSGALTLTQTDYTLPGRNGLDVEFKRIYKSGISNVQEMKVKYVNGAWVDYVHSDVNTSSFYEDRYNIGIGMRFSFPSIEVRKNEDGSSHKFLHTESGDIYRLKSALQDGNPIYLLEGQTIKDVIVKDSNEFTNGQSDGTSKYVMVGKDGKKTYFSEDGRILGIVDRYGNTIKFEYTTLSYAIDGVTLKKNLMTKIVDTVGRVITLEYKQDQAFQVGAIGNTQYGKEDSYKASQNPNTTDSGDLQGKFQVIVNVPGNKKLVYDKSAVLVSKTKHVIRTRLQRVYDVDNQPKYHFWYEQPELGFTYMNGKNYAVYNRHENLILIDYLKSNKLKRYIYNIYTKTLNKGSMQYEKIVERKDLIKTDFNPQAAMFWDKFVCETKDKTNYIYTNEADGFGFDGYEEYNDEYLKNTYRYFTETIDIFGNTTKYTYDGIHQLKTTEAYGKDHKEISTSEHDEMKLVKKKESTIYNLVNGQETGSSYKRIENYRYDEYGNLTNYTGPEAIRDDKGYPVDTEHTVIYSYAYDKYHVPTSKTWKKDSNTTCQIIYTVNEIGNVTKETRTNPEENGGWVVTDFLYDGIGNMSRKEVHSGSSSFITNYEYGVDAKGVDQKGAYLTKEYKHLDGVEIAQKYAYDFNTGNLKTEIDPKGKPTNYEYDVLSRVTKVTRPNETMKEYAYEEQPYSNSKVKYIDPKNTEYLYEYDILGNLLKASVYNNNQWNTLKSMAYDAHGNKTKEVDANGHSIRYAYDSQDRIASKTFYEKDANLKGSIAIKYSLAVDSNTSLLVTMTDEEGYIKKYYYDLLNRLSKTEFTPDKTNYIVNRYTYDYVGNRISELDGRNSEYQYEYDSLGRLIRKVDALGNETKYAYNSLNQITFIKEPQGKTTEHLYDALGRIVLKKTYQEGQHNYIYTKYAYDSNDNLVNLKQGDVFTEVNRVALDKTFAYNDMNYLTDEYQKVDAARTAHTKYSYDDNGQKTEMIAYTDHDQNGKLIFNYAYDYAGRLKDERGSYKLQTEGGELEYGSYHKTSQRDYAGNLIKEELKNTDGYDITTYIYDYRNLLIEKNEPYNSNENTKKTKYKYDKVGNLFAQISINQGQENTISYSYDGLGRILSKIDPLGNTHKYGYDSNGNLLKEVDPRYTHLGFDAAPGIEYIYDLNNQLVKTIAFDGTNREVISYKEYDQLGNMVKEADGEGYNENNTNQSIGNTYEYDAAGRIVKFTSAQAYADNQKNGTDFFTKKYLYDGLGNILVEEDSYGAKIETNYYLNGLIKEIIYPDGAQESFDYDLTGKTLLIKTDRKGNATKIYNTIFGTPYKIEYPDETTVTFQYDHKGKVVEQVNQVGNITTYKYDPSGNQRLRKEYIQSDNLATYYREVENTYDERNHLLSTETFMVKDIKLLGNADTRTSAGDKTIYEYDKAGRLLKVNGPAGREVIHEYDKASNIITRKQKVDGDYYDITRYTYDSRSRLQEESTLIKTADLDIKYLIGAKYDKTYFDRVLSTASFAYYKNNQIKTRKDPQGKSTIFEYDYDKRLTKKIDPLGVAANYQYDLKGNLIQEKNGKNAITVYDYDALNRLIRKRVPAADGSIAITRYVYDTMGNLTKTIAPNDYKADKDTPDLVNMMVGLSYTYDQMNRRTSTLAPTGEVMEFLSYNPSGLLQKTMDGLRYTGDVEESLGTTYSYDGLGRVIKTVNPLGQTTHFEYDVQDNLIKQIDGRNNTTSFAYNPDKTLAKITYADGGSIEFTYDRIGRKTSQKDQRENITLFSYNGFGKEREMKDAYNNRTESKYDLNGNLVSFKDKRGSVNSFAYDGLNRLVEKRTPLALDGSSNTVFAIEAYLYDEVGNLTRKTVTDSKDKLFKRETVYTYYDNSLLDTVADNSGAYAKTYYDKNGNIVKLEKLRDENNYDVERFEYDALNRMIKRIQLVDEADIYTGSGSFDVSSLKDGEYPGKLQRITGYAYDILGNKVKEIDPRAYSYAEADTASRAKYTVAFAYDALNRLEKITRKVNGVDVLRQYFYDEVGNKVKERNEKGYETTFTYDKVNRLQTITDPKQSTITYQYDLTGNKKSETNAKNYTMTYEYDKLNRLVTVIDPYNKVVTRNIYDANNNITKVIDGKGFLSAGTDDARYGTLYFYDLANRLVKIIDPEIAESNDPNLSTSKYQYNTVGQIIKETDGLGNEKVYEYDQAGRVIKVIDPLEISTTYNYDKAGNKLYMVDGRGKITKYQYGAFGKLRVVTNADDKSVQYHYDIAMNLASMLDRNGKQTLYSYDNRNLLLDKKVVGTMDQITYTYDALGNRASMVDDSGASSYSYDENSRLKEIKKGGISQVAYTYDAIGNVASVTDKKGFTTSYTYDKASRMETVGYKGKTTRYSYDENGNRQAINYHGGVKEEYVYDKNNRLVTLTNKGPSGSVLSSFTYTYDLAGRQNTKTDSFGTTSYVYDKAGRIIKVEAPGKTTIYGYDQAGNRQSMHETYTSAQPSGYTDPATQQTVQYSIKKSEYIYTNTNTLLKLVEKLQDETGKELLEKTTAYLYDANGNELRQTTSYMMAHNTKMRPSNGANPYGDTIEGDISSLIEKVSNTFDGFNRLKKTDKVKGGERVSVEYTYNGDGLRTQKTTKSSKDGYKAKVINYLYDRQHVILETDQNDNIITTYVRGINYIGRYDSTNHLSYYLYNGHGDVVQTVTESGQVENQYDYDIFGNPTLTIEVYENAIRYAGEFYDAETGLYYLRARYYDPYIGRFISEDSYWGEDTNPLSLNLYTYCENDPINFIDPSGHSRVDDIINEIDEQKEKWRDEFDSGRGGAGQKDWNDKQREAHDRANELRDELARLEKGNEDAEKLKEDKGDDAGTWEKFKHDREVAKSKSDGKVTKEEEKRIEESFEKMLAAKKIGVNAQGIKSSDLQKAFGVTSMDDIIKPSKNHTNANLIKIGDKGSDVKSIQELLIGAGIYKVKVNGIEVFLETDGVFGPATLEAVKQYQMKKGLSTDGVVGQHTLKALIASNNNKNAYLFDKYAPGSVARSGNYSGNYGSTIDQGTGQSGGASGTFGDKPGFVETLVTTTINNTKSDLNALEGIFNSDKRDATENYVNGMKEFFLEMSPDEKAQMWDNIRAAAKKDPNVYAMVIGSLLGIDDLVKIGRLDDVADIAKMDDAGKLERILVPNVGKHTSVPKGDISADPFWNNQALGQEVLNAAYPSSGTKQLYNISDSKLVKFQPDNSGGWHAYEVINPAQEVPTDVLRQMKNDGLISNSQYNKWIKNKK